MLLFSYLFLLLLCCHFLCDFALQSDYIARGKNRNIESLDPTKNVWMIILAAHAFIHSLPVLLLGLYLFGFESTVPLVFALFQLVTHIKIDFWKCENKYGYWMDQMFHYIVAFITALGYTVLSFV